MSSEKTPASEQEGLSRRGLLHAALFGGGMLLLVLAGDKSNVDLPGTALERYDYHRPLKIKLGAVAVTAAANDDERRLGQEEIVNRVLSQVSRIERDTSGAFNFEVSFFEDATGPDDVRSEGDARIGIYSHREMERIIGQYRRQLGERAIILAITDCERADIADTSVGGYAWGSPSFGGPCAVVRGGFSDPETIAHELGHLLNPSELRLGEGLGHQNAFDCRLNMEGSNGKVAQYRAIDTVQQLISNGCGLKKEPDNPGKVDRYASTVSVMGRGGDVQLLPLFSPDQMAFLNPRYEVQLVEPKPAEFTLSYEPGELFGVEVRLPRDHALRQIIPRADTLFFGLTAYSVELGITPDDDGRPIEKMDFNKRIDVFATWNGGRWSTHLTGGLINAGLRLSPVVYADEQLGFVAVAEPGGDRGETEKLRFVDINSSEGKKLLNDARKVRLPQIG